MFCKRRKMWQIQLCFFIILIKYVGFLKGLETNNSDTKILPNDFQNFENATSIFNNIVGLNNQSLLATNSSEMVVKKDLYIFPVNAPDLVISEKHEIHAIPVKQNETDNDTFTELREVNELSLSKLLPVNDSNAEGNGSAKNYEQNLPGHIPKSGVLEIVSGYEPQLGLVTKQIALPETIKTGITLPNKTIGDLISALNATENQNDSMKNDNDRKMRKREAEGKTEKLPIDGEEDMEVAEDIVFRPLFRYRQETRVRPQYSKISPDRRSNNRRRNPYRPYYDADYSERYRYRSRPRSNDYAYE